MYKKLIIGLCLTFCHLGLQCQCITDKKNPILNCFGKTATAQVGIGETPIPLRDSFLPSRLSGHVPGHRPGRTKRDHCSRPAFHNVFLLSYQYNVHSLSKHLDNRFTHGMDLYRPPSSDRYAITVRSHVTLRRLQPKLKITRAGPLKRNCVIDIHHVQSEQHKEKHTTWGSHLHWRSRQKLGGLWSYIGSEQYVLFRKAHLRVSFAGSFSC